MARLAVVLLPGMINEAAQPPCSRSAWHNGAASEQILSCIESRSYIRDIIPDLIGSSQRSQGCSIKSPCLFTGQ